jgi:hypothetical protein
MRQRFNQLLFVVSLLALCWYGMMAIHELGHVAGAMLSGGIVERVVVHPLTISRTDVAPNPNPLLVVWMGPIVGCAFPLLLAAFVPSQFSTARRITWFFAGFCLLANGAYIAIGSIDRVGDCGEMLKHGSPQWVLIAFGVAAATLGFYLWHRLGSIKQFIADPSLVEPKLAYILLLLTIVSLAAGFLFSPI